jgi:fatty-acyl-CoA synthase
VSQPLLLTEFLYRAQEFSPGKEIVQYQDGRQVHRYTYRDYYDRVVRLAGALVRLGIRPGDRVATLAWNHYRHLELYLAVPLTGAVLHTVNLRLEPGEIRYLLDHADDRVIAADASLLPALDAARAARPGMLVIGTDSAAPGVLDYEELIAGGPPLQDPPEVSEEDLAVLCYTSGTTGSPKGVGYSHRALYLHTFAACLADGHAISERDTALHVVPMFHANAWGIPFAALMSGANQVLPGQHPAPSDLARIIQAERVTYTGMVPTVAVDLVRHALASGADLTSLRAFVIGGSPPSEELVRMIEEQLRVPVFQGWGMTEISPMGTFSRPLPQAEHDATARRRYIRKQGRLLPGLRWRLVDGEGRDQPHDGVARGELLIRGPWVANSYFRDEYPDSFIDGWLRTGDIATIDADGYLEIVDRAKDLIKSGGEWISSVALEQALMAHPAVAEAAVIAVPHERWQERPFALVVLEDGRTAEPGELLDDLQGRVPRWWLPDGVRIIDELPRTSVGKIDKKRLRDTLAAGGVVGSHN